MDATITRPVIEIPANEKKALEGMLGTSFEAGQEIFNSAYTPVAVPSDDACGGARHGIEQFFSENRVLAKEKGITSVEADDAVAEAMRIIRDRK